MPFKTLLAIKQDLKSAPVAIKRISLAMAFYFIAWSFLDPFLPIYFTELLGGYSQSTLAISILYIFSAFWSVPIGRLADIFAKKKLLSLVLFFYLPMIPILGFLRTIFHVFVYRIFHSFLATGLWSTSETYVRAHSDKKHRAEAMGIFDSSYTLAVIAGAVLGGFFVAKFGIKPLFFLAPIPILTAFLFVRARLPDHSGSNNLRDVLPFLKLSVFWDSIRDFWGHKKLVLITLFSFLYGLPLLAVGSVLLPLFSDALGANPIQIGLVYALSALPFIFEAPFSFFSDHFSNRKILIFAGFFSAAVFTALFFVQNIYWLFPLSFLSGLSFAILIPTVGGRVTALMPLSHVGELNGVYRALILLSYGLGIFIVGPLADSFGINSPFLFSAGLMIIFSVLVFCLWRKVGP